MLRIMTLSTLAMAVPAAMVAQSDSAAPDPGKSRYSLFRPTPGDQMRELSPDRPDKTESPYTLDAGHFQVEMDFVNYTTDAAADITVHAWNVAPINLKAGLLNNVDLQLVYDNYLNVQTRDNASGITRRQSGFGDITARVKINLWGNDGGRTAFGLLPFVKFPVNTDGLGNSAVEGGLILPLAVNLPHGFDLGMEVAALVLKNDADGDYHADIVQSVTVGHTLVGDLGGYVEFYSELSTLRHSPWVATVDVGLVYQVGKNVQFDCGCNFGLTGAADDFNPFAGVTIRF